jgi:hypothetical protein
MPEVTGGQPKRGSRLLSVQPAGGIWSAIHAGMQRSVGTNPRPQYTCGLCAYGQASGAVGCLTGLVAVA